MKKNQTGTDKFSKNRKWNDSAINFIEMCIWEN